MKNFLGPLAIAVLAFSVSGCDLFPALAARPTSAQTPPHTLDCSAACAAACDTCTACDICTACDTLSVCDTCTACDTLSVRDTIAVCDTIALCDTLAVCEPCAASDTAAVCETKAVCETQEAVAEHVIIGNLGQRTGFLKIDVSFNNARLVNSVESGYYILIGTFTQKANADKLEKLASRCGEKVTRLEFVNGKTAIALRRSDNVNDAFVALGEVRKLSCSPKDACILVVE